MLDQLEVPAQFQRNAPSIKKAGYETTGEILIKLATTSCGLDSLENLDVLDVGCGVRFTSAIINRLIPIGSYTGIEVNPDVVDFLKREVEPKDERFSYTRWNMHNALYNPEGEVMDASACLPVEQDFDVIWLFSVFTHMNPDDSVTLLQLLRKQIRPGGKLFFTAFIDDKLVGFDDRYTERPLLHAYYGRETMIEMVESNGWKIDAFHDQDMEKFIQHHLVCSPA